MRWSLINNYWKKMYRSNSRMALTLSGLVLSVVILMIGMIISETYLESQQYLIQPFRDNNAVIEQSKVDYKTYEYFKGQEKYNMGMEIQDNLVYHFMDLQKGGYIDEIYGNGIKVDENMNLKFIQSGTDSTERYSSKLVSGRLISKEDIYNKEKVMVIDDALAEVMFGTKEAVGEEIRFPVHSGTGKIEYESFEVIGVIEASDLSKNTLDALKKRYTEENGTQLPEEKNRIIFNFYMPYSVKFINYDSSYSVMNLIFTSSTDNYRDIRYELMQDERTNQFIDFQNMVDADTLYNMLAADIKSSQESILYAVLIIFVISGLSMMNTMLFSVKERINEIGIRKAIGAFNIDIVGQFIFEGFVYGLISSVIGVTISVILSSHIFLILNDSISGLERLVISKEAIILSIAASILAGVLASIIPAVYSSHIKVADALRFE